MNRTKINKTIRRYVAILLAVSGISVSTAVEARQWSLEECIRRAIDYNISIKQTTIRKESAEIDVNTAVNSRLPNLSASSSQNWSFGRTQIQSGLYENSSQSNTGISIGTSVPLFTGFRIKNEIEKSRFDLLAATENLEAAKENLALNVTSLYLQALFNREVLKINEEQLNLTKTMVERTKILFEADKVPASQVYDIEARQAKDEVSVVQARNSLSLALLDLAQALEIEDPSQFDILAPSTDDISTDNLLLPDVVFNNALSLRPAIREQAHRLSGAYRTLEIARSGLLPSLSMSAGYSTNYFYRYGSFPNTSFGNQIRNNGSEYIGLSLNIPIFNRFSVRNQMKNARLNINSQALALENVKKTLYKEIQTAHINAVSALEKYRASASAVAAMSQSLKFVEEKYNAGRSSVFEYNEAKTALTQSLSEQIQAKYDYIFRVKILEFYNK